VGRDMRTGFLLIKEKERDHLQDLGVDGNITRIWILNKQVKEGIYCIFVAQNKNNLPALVKQVTNFRVPKNTRDFWSS